MSSLKTYCTDGIGWNLYDEPHDMMCQVYENALPPPPDQFLDARQKYTMTLFPRETFKTSIGCQALAEYYALRMKVLYDYDTRILIIRSAREASQSVLGAIEQDLSNINPVLQRAFGDLSDNAPEWNESAATLGWRTTAYREPTFDAASTGTSRTGWHYDLIIVDDIANENNYESESEMRKARNYLTSLFPVLNSWGSLLVIGTRWGFDDPYGFIIDFNERQKAAGKPVLWDIHNEGYRKQDGELFYPVWLSEERIQEKREVMYAMTGSDKLWMASYLNRVTTDESSVFKKSEQRFYDGVYYPAGDMAAELHVKTGNLAGSVIPVECMMHVDPATSVTDRANKTGIAIVLTDKERNCWVHDSWGGKELPADLVSRITSMARYYQPTTISIDVWGQQVLWVDRLRDSLDAADLHHISVTQYRGLDGRPGRGALSKAKRIESLGLLFREGRIFLHQGKVGPVVKELDTYNGVTASNHFDVLDALSHTMQLAKPPRADRYSEDLEALEEESEDWDEPETFEKVAAGVAGLRYAQPKPRGPREFDPCIHSLHPGLCYQCAHVVQ